MKIQVNKVQVQFVQMRKEGETVLNAKPLTIESNSISEVAGTIVSNIVRTRLMLVRYGAKLKGFSFNRKFNVRITINESEPVDFSTLYGLEGVNCNRTLIVKKDDAIKTEKTLKNFSEQIYDLVRLSMTGMHLMVEDIDEVIEELPQKIESISNVKVIEA